MIHANKKAAAQKAAAEKAEADRLAAEKAATETAEADKAAAEKAAAEQAAAEKAADEKAEAEKREEQRLASLHAEEEQEGKDEEQTTVDLSKLYTPSVQQRMLALLDEQLAAADRDVRQGPSGLGWRFNETQKQETEEWFAFLSAAKESFPA